MAGGETVILYTCNEKGLFNCRYDKKDINIITTRDKDTKLRLHKSLFGHTLNTDCVQVWNPYLKQGMENLKV